MQKKDNVSLLKQLISESLLRESVTVFDPTLSDELSRSEAHARLLLTREPDLAVVRDSTGTWFAGHPGMPACVKWGQKPIFGSGGKPTGRYTEPQWIDGTYSDVRIPRGAFTGAKLQALQAAAARDHLLQLESDVTEFDERPTSADVIALFGPKPKTEPAAEARLEIFYKCKQLAARAIASIPELNPGEQSADDLIANGCVEDLIDHGTRAERAAVRAAMLRLTQVNERKTAHLTEIKFADATAVSPAGVPTQAIATAIAEAQNAKKTYDFNCKITSRDKWHTGSHQRAAIALKRAMRKLAAIIRPSLKLDKEYLGPLLRATSSLLDHIDSSGEVGNANDFEHEAERWLASVSSEL
jgi:hypothetical protein